MSASPLPQPVAPIATSTEQPAPRWARQRSFFDRRQAAFWLFAVLLVFTGLSVLTEQMTYLEVFPAGWMFSIGLLALYALPVAVAIYMLDLFEREPVSMVVAAFLWGGVIAIGLAGPINTAWIEIIGKTIGPEFARAWGAALVAPPVEEILKLLGVVTIFLVARDEIDDLIDGFVYGAVAGLGFAAVENVQYFVQAIAGAGGGDQIGPVLRSFLLRVVFAGPYMHVLWSGIAGLGFAYYVTQRDAPHQRRLLVFLGLFALAVAAHVVWNSPLLGELVGAGPVGWLAFGLIKGAPFFIFLLLIVRLAHRREQHWFQAATRDHLGEDVLTPAEIAQLGGLRSRWRARREVARRKGPAGGQLQGRIQRAQIQLALVRTQVGTDDHPSVVEQVTMIRALRTELTALPDLPQPMLQPAPQPTPQPTQQPATQQQPTTQAQAPNEPQAAATERQSSQPSAPPPPTAAPTGWSATHVVPTQGLAAWSAPDPAQPPVATLGAGIPLRLLEVLGAWARVDAVNGWSGWVDARLLVALPPAGAQPPATG